MSDNEDRRRLLRNNPLDRTRCGRTCCCVTAIVVLIILVAVGVLVGVFVGARRNENTSTTPQQTTTAHPTTHTIIPTTVATTPPHESTTLEPTTKSSVKKYFRIRSVLCNKPLCASGEKSPIVICENGSAYDWFQSADNTTIRWRNEDRLGFDGEGHHFQLIRLTGLPRQFWFIDGDRIANRNVLTKEVADLKDSNCNNGAEIQRLTYNASAENQKWDFVYIN